MADVYIASSWKNRERVRALAIALRQHGVSVYDFTDPTSRGTPAIRPEQFPEQFDPDNRVYREYITAVPEWRGIAECDRRALDACRIVVLLLPCGSDAHADWGYAVGRGKRNAVVGSPNAGDRTFAHMWSDALLTTDEEAVEWCAGLL